MLAESSIVERWILLFFFALLPLYWLYSWVPYIKRKRARRRTVAKWAAGRNLKFQPRAYPQMKERYAFLSCLWQGPPRFRFAFNGTRGRIEPKEGRAWGGGTITTFDYFYRNNLWFSIRENEDYTWFSVLVIEADVVFPSMLIRPARSSDNIAGLLNAREIRLESESFNRRFTVRCDNREWAFAFLSPKAMELIEEHSGFTIEIAGNAIALHNGNIFDPKTFDTAISLVLTLLDKMPRDVVETMRFERKPRR